MTYWEAIQTLHKHFCLSGRRNKIWQANNVAKYFYYVLAVFLCAYFVWIGCELADLVIEDKLGGYRFIYALIPVFLFIDYLFRYTTDHRLLMHIRPYLLLPLPKHSYTDYLILRQLIVFKNVNLLFICIPFGIKTLIPELGASAMIGYTAGLYLLLLVNGQFFQLTQVLTARGLWYWLIPILTYLSIAIITIFFPSPQGYLQRWAEIGNSMIRGEVWIYAVMILLLIGMILLNRNILEHRILQEQYTAAPAKHDKNSIDLTIFDRFNQIGEYLKIEVWGILRNKRLRLIFFLNTFGIFIFSLITAFDPESDMVKINGFVYYSFIIYGLSSLSRIMCYEGNYYECLLMQRNSIQNLLLAKYYFYTALLLIPLLVFLPVALIGKISFWTILSYALFAAGVAYRILFQMAVYNKVTFSMQATHTGKNANTNYIQLIVTIITIISPFPIAALGTWWLNQPILTNTTLSLLGIIFITTHRRWISSISRKMKDNQYEQLEGFQKSR
ncbi:DUF5687 family protein [Prevotella melaninogenica]|uniref:DUF5687 family protein n=1 Tax=Prevotella melaninogenica TaxID=28132 RepID=UPI001BA8B9E5|nr:DUF5687 family protein [Prevotella melaninogenica]QUB66485.1 hypothetical protein J5A57_11505 [Prevotella melaninogenica]